MTDKIKVTETKMLLFDMILGQAIRVLIGEYKKVLNASEEELKEMEEKINKRFKNAFDKLKSS